MHISECKILEPHSLPSGRSVIVRVEDSEERLEVHSPDGEIELTVVLTDSGPVVRLRGGRLELDGGEVALRCRNFSVAAEEEIRLRAGGDVHVNGEVVRLNC